VSRLLRDLSPTALRELAAAIGAGTVGVPFSTLALGRLGLGTPPEAVSDELNGLLRIGASPPVLARMLDALAAERAEAQYTADRTELVWTGPESQGSRTRDTSVVVRQLFASAERTVLVSSYAVYDGRAVFEPLIERMAQVPTLQVRLFLNVARPSDGTAEDQALRNAASEFLRYHWSGDRMPEVYYDPRSLAPGTADKAVLHAKVIVVDDAQAFVTSANFTEAAHQRNIEAGVLVQSQGLAISLRRQFDGLVGSGVLKTLPFVIGRG
jgi:phosphatidylserine/phosphatidylglycerophosphate/cardiolipin synthase-like enzyme